MSQFSEAGVSVPPGPAFRCRKHGLSEMRCRGQLEQKNERPLN